MFYGYNIQIWRKLEKLLDTKGSRMMPPPGLQIYLRPCSTLTFDLFWRVVVTQRAFTVICLPDLIKIRQSSWDISLKWIFVTYFGLAWPWSLTSWPQKWHVLCCHVDYLYQRASESVHSFQKCSQVWQWTNRIRTDRRTKGQTDERTDERTDGRTDRRTKGQIANIMPPAASLAWRSIKT